MTNQFEEDIKYDASDGVGYSGLVEIGLIRNNKKYPKIFCNRGTINLFRFICDCLAARFNPVSIDINKRPMRLNLIKASGGSVLSRSIPFSDILIKEDTATPACSITFSFLIPGTSAFQVDIGALQLVSSDSSIVYAEVNLGTDTIRVNQIDTNVYVSWTLNIKNQ